MDVSQTLISDARAMGDRTLLAANDFLIPILQEAFTCTPVSDDFLEAWEKRSFFEAAVNVVRSGPVLARRCYRKALGACGLAVEFSIAVPEDHFDRSGPDFAELLKSKATPQNVLW